MIIKGESEAHTIPSIGDSLFDKAVETSVNISMPITSNLTSAHATSKRKFKMVFDRATLTKRLLLQNKASVNSHFS